jgi:hypothetical protein
MLIIFEDAQQFAFCTLPYSHAHFAAFPPRPLGEGRGEGGMSTCSVHPSCSLATRGKTSHSPSFLPLAHFAACRRGILPGLFRPKALNKNCESFGKPPKVLTSAPASASRSTGAKSPPLRKGGQAGSRQLQPGSGVTHTVTSLPTPSHLYPVH